MEPFLDIRQVDFAYGSRPALQGVSFPAPAGAFVALLGPNGSGKTTLFRVLAGLQRPAGGTAQVLGLDVAKDLSAIRRALGIVFQHPSLDDKLTVGENLRHSGHLYGLRGSRLRDRIDALLSEFSLTERQADRVGTLSGGLQRRVELARSLLHEPAGLFLDEPTTGLDPSARLDFWSTIEAIHGRQRLAVLYTTHWFEEAERADLVGIMDNGRLVAYGAPDALRGEVGQEMVTLTTAKPAALAVEIQSRYLVTPQVQRNKLRFGVDRGHEVVADLLATCGDRIDAIAAGKPTLEDVYVLRTGKSLYGQESP